MTVPFLVVAFLPLWRYTTSMSIGNVRKSSRKRGRPFADTEPITVRIGKKLMSGLDEWRKLQDDLPTRPEGIRRMMEIVIAGSVRK